MGVYEMKQFKNKKMMTGIIASLVGVSILMTGLTLAWFTSTGNVSSNDINLGTLKVVGELLTTNEVNMLPGVSIDNNIGWIQNLGMDALAQLKFDIEVTKKSTLDADGNAVPIDNPDDYIKVVNPPEVWLEIQEDGYATPAIGPFPAEVIAHPLGVWMRDASADGTMEFYTWAKVGAPDNRLFVAMGGNDKLHFAYSIKNNGAAMNNSWQGATVNVKFTWDAIQISPDAAIFDRFGANLSDILFWELPGVVFLTASDASPFQPFNIVIQTPAERFAAKVASMPEGAFKTYIESKYDVFFE